MLSQESLGIITRMSESLFELLGGSVGAVLGAWLVRASFRPTLPSSFLVWWLSEDDPMRDSISRGLSRIVGGWFIIIGGGLIVMGSVGVLRHLSFP